MLKCEDADAARIIILLTDGRVDTFQGERSLFFTSCILLACIFLMVLMGYYAVKSLWVWMAWQGARQ